MNPNWISAIVSVTMGLLVTGGYLSVIREHSKRLDEHDELHKETEKHDALQDVALAKLESWQEGYRAATARYGGNKQNFTAEKA